MVQITLMEKVGRQVGEIDEGRERERVRLDDDDNDDGVRKH